MPAGPCGIRHGWGFGRTSRQRRKRRRTRRHVIVSIPFVRLSVRCRRILQADRDRLVGGGNRDRIVLTLAHADIVDAGGGRLHGRADIKAAEAVRQILLDDGSLSVVDAHQEVRLGARGRDDVACVLRCREAEEALVDDFVVERRSGRHKAADVEVGRIAVRGVELDGRMVGDGAVRVEDVSQTERLLVVFGRRGRHDDRIGARLPGNNVNAAVILLIVNRVIDNQRHLKVVFVVIRLDRDAERHRLGRLSRREMIETAGL